MNLVLSSARGKQRLRHFPHDGYLGLTPVVLQGSVSLALIPPFKSVKAKSLSVSVRCYESRLGPLFPSRSNVLADYTHVLWSKPPNIDYDDISVLECPFLITLPVDAPGFSTFVFVDYRCVWRIEAVLEHAPIYGIGSCQSKHIDLLLTRYDLPSYEPTTPQPVLNLFTNNPKAPRLSYCIHSPTAPVGPGDFLSIPVFLRPLDSGVVIRTVTLTIERRIQFKDNGHSSIPRRGKTILSSSSSQPTSPAFYPSTSSYCELDYVDSSSTAALLPPPQPSKRPSTAPVFPSHALNFDKTVSDLIVGAEPSGIFSKDRNGIWSTVLTLQWPAAKSHNKWAVGESIQSSLVSVQFFLHVKVIVSAPTGVHSIELAEKELPVVSTGDAERKLVTAKYASRKGHEPRKTPSGPEKKRRQPTSAGTRDNVGLHSSEKKDSIPPTIFLSTVDSTDRSSVEREWEEELARIERRSRRFSEQVGFPWKRTH